MFTWDLRDNCVHPCSNLDPETASLLYLKGGPLLVNLTFFYTFYKLQTHVLSKEYAESKGSDQPYINLNLQFVSPIYHSYYNFVTICHIIILYMHVCIYIKYIYI